MRVNYTRSAAAGFWVLAMFAIGVALGTTSVIGWVVLAGLALVPPLVKRLARMKTEIDRGQEALDRKLRYLLWLN